MFFYLSFLRTPPQSNLQSSSVVFTPQVTNDLRTEPFPTSMDIYYWWISYAPAEPHNNVTRLSEPTKLTTWRQENAYKPLQIPPPPSKNLIRAAAGPEIDCSLVLAPAPIVASSVIDLRDPEIGKVPLPVYSLPIRISISPQQQQQQQQQSRRRRDGGGGGATASTTKSSKQEAIIRTFRIFDDVGLRLGLGDVQTPLIHIKETVSFDLDKKLWDSGIGLSAWLVRLSVAVADSDGSAVQVESESSESITSPLQPAIVQELKERLFRYSNKGCNVIELGAGTGIVSLVLAGLLHSASLASLAPTSHAESCILSTDLPSSMELMSYNIRANAALYPNCAPIALPLDWDDEELPETVRSIRERGGFDLIVMADVAYNTSSFPALLRTLASLLALSNNAQSHHDDNSDDVQVSDDDAREDDPGTQSQEGEEKADRDYHEERGCASGQWCRDDLDPLVLLAYKERDPAERQLWDMMARETGVVLECVGKQAGAGGLPVEIWLGKRKKGNRRRL